MIEFQGHWYDGKTSNRVRAVCRAGGAGPVVVASEDDGRILTTAGLDQLTIPNGLSGLARWISFPDGSKLETLDNAAVEELIRRHKPRPVAAIIRRLETRWPYAAASVIALVGFLYLFSVYGVPAAAKAIADRLPRSVYAAADSLTLQTLDSRFLSQTKLTDEVQRRVMAHFEPALKAHPQLRLKVVFRQGGKLGANAFALPGGTIIFTDKMVELAQDDDELLGVLAHEIGHVHYNHGMRSVVRSSLLAFTLMAISGDASGSSELFLGLPVVILNRKRSRGFETEADDFALQYLKARRIDPRNFANLMKRLAKTSRPAGKGDLLGDYLSTHPRMEDRLKAFEADR